MTECTDAGRLDRRGMRERAETAANESVVNSLGPAIKTAAIRELGHNLLTTLDLTDTLVERLRGAVRRCTVCRRGPTPCFECRDDLALLASLGEGEG